jgi:hypothetical protein
LALALRAPALVAFHVAIEFGLDGVRGEVRRQRGLCGEGRGHQQDSEQVHLGDSAGLGSPSIALQSSGRKR